MAKIPFGILGPLIGSICPVTGKTWKDISTLSGKRKPAKTDKEPTPAQLNLRERFGFVSKFLSGLGPLVKHSFIEQAKGKTEFQCAVAYNVSNAVSGAHPNYTLHYERVFVARGILPNAELPEAKPGDAPGDIRFTWADNTGIGTAAATDKAIAVVYVPGEGQWAYRDVEATRSDCSIVYNITDISGTVHTWLLFVSDNRQVSDSVYTGALVL